jgi:hypothetical protein
MVMSLFPMWCDEYERLYPIINPQNITDASLSQQNNLSTNQEDAGISNNADNNSANSQSLINFNRSNNNSNQIEGELQNDKNGQYSEKVLIKSSNDTRLANPSVDQNNKYHLVEENENKTENEFVFSENVNIDTLSYNEPIIEKWKKKYDKEHEE